MHVPITLDCLNHGYHVLCEKPLARRAAEVDTLIAAAQENDKILAIFQQSRYAPAFRKLREVIDSGVLGRIVQISIAYNGFARRWDWQTLQEYNGGNLLNTGPHPVDQALQLFGTDIMPQVTCIMDEPTPSVMPRIMSAPASRSWPAHHRRRDLLLLCLPASPIMCREPMVGSRAPLLT